MRTHWFWFDASYVERTSERANGKVTVTWLVFLKELVELIYLRFAGPVNTPQVKKWTAERENVCESVCMSVSDQSVFHVSPVLLCVNLTVACFILCARRISKGWLGGNCGTWKYFLWTLTSFFVVVVCVVCKTFKGLFLHTKICLKGNFSSLVLPG